MGGIFNSTVLDVAIGLTFVYLLLGIFCTAINEWIAGIFKTRANTLKEGIHILLDNQPFGNARFLDAFYKHPVIAGMTRGDAHPSYLAARTFATTLMDLATPTVKGPIAVQDLVAGVNALPDGDVKSALVALVGSAGNDIEKAQRNIEDWFNDSMDRVSGWYKRTVQIWTIAIAVALTVVANADTLALARQLWVDPALRSAVVEQAKQRAQMPRPTSIVEYTDKNDPLKPTVKPTQSDTLTEQESRTLGRIVGWTRASVPTDAEHWLLRILGWIFTVIAVSLGAPFWFDSLNRLMNLRSAGLEPAKQAA